MSISGNLSHYLARCSHYEMMAERIRQKIAANPYYQMETVFARIDKFSKGCLVPDDFSQFMLDNQIYPNEIELYLLFRDFDQLRAGTVSLSQLTQHLLPKENPQLHEQAARKKYYQSGARLEMDLEYIIAKYFQHKLRQIKQLAVLRVEMFRKQPYTVEEAFGLVDAQRKGLLTQPAQLDQFLRRNGKLLAQNELARVFRVLSFDRAELTFECFSEHLDPLGKGYYIGYSQRLAQKELLQQGYLRQRLQLKEQTAKSHLQLAGSIANLQQSNCRLSRRISEQQVERRVQEEEELRACRPGRGRW